MYFKNHPTSFSHHQTTNDCFCHSNNFVTPEPSSPFEPMVPSKELKMGIPSKKEHYVSIIQNCAFLCHHLSMKLNPPHQSLSQLLQSTARLCNEQAHLFVSNSVFTKDHALLCAKACDVTQDKLKEFLNGDKEPVHLLQKCRDYCYDYANRL